LKTLDIERLFQHSLGVFLGSNPKIIRRYFTGWALSHVVACPLHSSQTKPVYVENVDVIHLGEEGKGKLVGLVALETYNSQELSFRLARQAKILTADYFAQFKQKKMILHRAMQTISFKSGKPYAATSGATIVYFNPRLQG